MASPLPAVAGVAPEPTVAAPLVVPLADACWSTGFASVDRSAYSIASTPTSAAPDTVALMDGVFPAPPVTGAVQTLSSVPSLAVRCDTRVNVSPAESVTPGDACGGEPMYGVTVYPVIGLPPSFGADQDTVALASPGIAVTFDGAAGAVAGLLSLMIGATAGTPLSFRANSM